MRAVIAYGADNFPNAANDPDAEHDRQRLHRHLAAALATKYDASISTVAGAPFVINPAGFTGSATDFCLTAVDRAAGSPRSTARRHLRSAPSSLPAPARSADAELGENAVNLTISPQIRILALVGLLAALGLGASMFVFGRGSSKTAEPAAATHATPALLDADEAAHDSAHARDARQGGPRSRAAAKHATKTHAATRTHAKKAQAGRLPRQPRLRDPAAAAAVAARAPQDRRRQPLQPRARRRRDLGRRGARRGDRRRRRLPARERARQQGRRDPHGAPAGRRPAARSGRARLPRTRRRRAPARRLRRPRLGRAGGDERDSRARPARPCDSPAAARRAAAPTTATP